MDSNLLLEKVQLIIQGIERMCDPEVENEFIKLLNDFTLKQMKRCDVEIARQKSQLN